MPQLSYFYGIVVQMYADDHPPPHFHARYSGHEVVVDIRELRIIQGRFPGRAMGMLLQWAAEHRDELLENWKRCEQNETTRKISPLK